MSALVLGAIVGATFFLTGGRGGDALAVLRTADFHALAFSPSDPDTIFFGHHNGVMRSIDGGATWQALVARPNFDAMGMAVSRAESHRIFLAGHDVFQLSEDGGASWRPLAHNLPGTDIHGFAMSPDDPDRLYAFVVRHGLFRSTDGGRTWTQASGGLPGDVMALAAAGGTPEILYAGSMRAGVLKSVDGGRTWLVTGTLPSATAFTLAVDPSRRESIYAGIAGGVVKSTDAGASWSMLSFPGDNVVAIAVNPSRPNMLLAITVKQGQGVVYRSEDSGKTWGGGNRE